MEPKPKGWSRQYAEWFDSASAVGNYRYRPPYPRELFEILASIAGDPPVAVLDVGCGPGDIARPLAELVTRVDAIDLSPRMIAEAKRRPGGDAPNISWTVGAIEAAALQPPYRLVTAGDSIHWFDWPVVMPRLARALTSAGRLAIVQRGFQRSWFRRTEIRSALEPVYARFGVIPDHHPDDPVVEVERRGLFARAGEQTTAPVPWRPTLSEIIRCHHSQTSFMVERMGARAVAAFDLELEQVFDSLVREGVVTESDGRYELDVTATVVWGGPTA